METVGFEVVGKAPTLDHALILVETTEFDLALLDANLDGVSAMPIGQALVVRGIPYIVLSGYSEQQQAGKFAGAAAHLQKPCTPQHLIDAIKKYAQPVV